VALPLKFFRNEHLNILFVLWVKRLDANHIQSEMHPVTDKKNSTYVQN